MKEVKLDIWQEWVCPKCKAKGGRVVEGGNEEWRMCKNHQEITAMHMTSFRKMVFN